MSNLLAVFDFDCTLIDEDSDRNVFAKLSNELLEKLYSLTSQVQWTDLIHMLLGELSQKGFTKDDIIFAQESIDFKIETAEMLGTLKKHLCDVVILSDANTTFIDIILKKNNCHDYIDKTITNPSWFDENGRLHVQRYLTQDKSPHGCSRPCGPNLCKGKELSEHLNQSSKKYKHVIYSGDGRNDFCPVSKLTESDYAMVRSGHALEKLVKEFPEQVKAKVIYWQSQQELLEKMSELMYKLNQNN